MSEPNIQQDDLSPPNLGPGDRLQAARLSLGMTVDEIAKKMCLSTAILNSLEDNDFEAITAPIFVKGYLRSYARLVNIDENEIIEQYSSSNTEDDPPISSTRNISTAINVDESGTRRLTYLVIAGLIVLLSFWWWNRYQQPAETLSLDAVEEPVLSSRPETTETEMTEEIAVEAALEVLVEADVPQPEEQASSVDRLSIEPMAGERVISEMEKTEVVEPEVVESIESVATTEIEPLSQDNSVEEITDVVNEVETLTEPVIDAGQDEQQLESTEPVDQKGLVITVIADSWVNIKDADGNKLVYDLLRSGEKITVDGKTPLRAFLGNGHGVSLQYMGKEIDLSTLIRDDNTARVRIGQ